MQNDLPTERLEYESRTDQRRRYWPKVIKVTIVITILVLAMVTLLPLLNRPYDGNPRLACASHLRQFGLAAVMYANQHNKKMPDNLQTLFDENELEPGVLTCPLSTLPSLNGATTQTADAAIRSNQVSYIYLGKGLTVDAPDDTVLMYEPLGDHGDGINVLFFDCHVEWLDLAEAKRLIALVGSGQNPVRYPATAPGTHP